MNFFIFCIILASPVLKLTQFKGNLFEYFVLVNSRYHRIDIFLQLIETEKNYYLFHDTNQTNLSLSMEYRIELARTGYIFETLLVGELSPYNFQYTDGRLKSGKYSNNRFFPQPIVFLRYYQ